MSGCRISKVTDKRTGRSLHLLPASRIGDAGRRLIRDARTLAEYYPGDEMAAFAVVAIGCEGHFSRGMFVHKDAAFGPSLLPSLVAEVLRRDVVEEQIMDGFVRNGFLRPPEDDPA